MKKDEKLKKMAAAKKLSWNFPLKEFVFLRIEILTITLLSLIVFFLALLQSENSWFYALLSVLLFLGLYMLFSAIIQKIRRIKEKYHLTRTHLQITRKTKKKTRKEKVSWKEVKQHKLDKLFLGGYLITHKGKKHPLFFNTKQEIERFEQFIKKNLTGKKRK